MLFNIAYIQERRDFIFNLGRLRNTPNDEKIKVPDSLLLSSFTGNSPVITPLSRSQNVAHLVPLFHRVIYTYWMEDHSSLLVLWIDIFLSKVDIWNINCVRATTFIFDTGTDVLDKVSKLFGTENVSTWGVLEPPTFGFMPNILTCNWILMVFRLDKYILHG